MSRMSCFGYSRRPDCDNVDRGASCTYTLVCQVVVGTPLWNRCHPRPTQGAGDAICCACDGALLGAAQPFVVRDASSSLSSPQNADSSQLACALQVDTDADLVRSLGRSRRDMVPEVVYFDSRRAGTSCCGLLFVLESQRPSNLGRSRLATPELRRLLPIG